MAPEPDVTRLLLAWNGGEESAAAPLMDAVYTELRRLAGVHLQRERREHSLPATALVHEAYLKLVDQRRVRWQNRTHFFAIASQVMRRLLVDHPRARAASKRGADLTVALEDIEVPSPIRAPDVIALDAALEKLQARPTAGTARGIAVLRRAHCR